MNDISEIRKALIQLREDAKLSQAELAKRLECVPSRLSRLESGDLQLTLDEARGIAAKIGETHSPAKLFGEYIDWEWTVLERPGFQHVSLGALWKAEQALHQLDPLLNDPNIKNAFAQQIKSCREGIYRAALYLADTEHGIAFIGPPKVGKTTSICALSDLRDPSQTELGDQMALQTGGGRVTVCEVHVRSGDEYAIIVDACTHDELRQFVTEFCDDLRRDAGGDGKAAGGDMGKLPAEVERALRNMAKLPRPRSQRGPDGKMTTPEDPAEVLAQRLSKEDLLVEIMTKLDLPRRIRASVKFPQGSVAGGLKWLKQTYREINFGLHPEFSLPRRIEVVVPEPVLGVSSPAIRLIDTRGNDEPFAPRRDLQNYFDDPRTAIVLCSSFGDAPDAASQVLIERSAENSTRNPLSTKGLLLVLPQDKEERTVLNQSTGEAVASEEEGREIRHYEARTKLDHLNASFLPVGFLNALRTEDCEAMKGRLLELILEMRRQYEVQVDELSQTVHDLLSNKQVAETRAVLDAAMRPLQVWFDNHQELEEVDHDIEAKLLRDMGAIRYAGTLRASVNRRGAWDNFDYWLGLGLGTRQHTVARTAEQLTVLRGLIQNALDDSEWAPAHGFLRHFRNQIDQAIAEFEQHVQAVGESAFSEQLRSDANYWTKCQGRWGQGKGYKDDLAYWTKQWFEEDSTHRKDRYDYIDREVQRRWREMLVKLSTQLRSDEATASGDAT
jgi:transcriptional regulator with XRE-family HTH domain